MLRSYGIVAIQLTLIVFLGWYGGWFGASLPNALLFCAGLIGAWAVSTMHFRFSVLPEVRANQRLYTGGPYRFVRHPMYTAVLLATLAWVLNRPDVISFLAWFALGIDLRVKMGSEERWLAERFPEYAAYAARTRRLIPWIY